MAIDRWQMKRGSTAEWLDTDSRVLADGEPGFERDTGKMKIGNGVSPWNALPYVSQGEQGPPGTTSIQPDPEYPGLYTF